jgi:hypothetical protein
LRELEGACENGIFVVCFVFAHTQRVCRVIEEELGRGVDRQLEEQGLQIDRRAISGNLLEHELEVTIEGLQVRNLIARKVGPEKVPAILPLLTITVEDAVAEQRRKR